MWHVIIIIVIVIMMKIIMIIKITRIRIGGIIIIRIVI